MAKRIEVREWPKSQLAWGLYNYGRLIEIRLRRKDAMRAAEEITGTPWSYAKQSMEVHKVRVEKFAP